jgi:hypothetical protein
MTRRFGTRFGARRGSYLAMANPFSGPFLAANEDVRFTPESGHLRGSPVCAASHECKRRAIQARSNTPRSPVQRRRSGSCQSHGHRTRPYISPSPAGGGTPPPSRFLGSTMIRSTRLIFNSPLRLVFVRSYPESGHVRCTNPCPLCANSGHGANYSMLSLA